MTEDLSGYTNFSTKWYRSREEAEGENFKTSEEILKEQVKAIKSFYVIGALANNQIAQFSNELEAQGYEAFSDWRTPGPEADGFLLEYSKIRGRTYKQILKSYAAQNTFRFDKTHLDRTDAAVLLMKAGKSAHLELGYTIGRGKPGFIVFDEEPSRVDIMYNFATEVFFSKQEFFDYLKNIKEN